MGIARYFKAAFTNRWNLLAFCGALGFAALSGAAGFFVPLVVAGELTYLGLLGSHPKFQRYVDAQDAASDRRDGSEATRQSLWRIMNALPVELRGRYERLRQNCLELQQIAGDLKHPGQADLDQSLERFQTAGLDRLLWIYLRLLYTHFSLSRFLSRTGEDRIAADIKRLEGQLTETGQGDDTPQKQKARATLDDNLKTSRERLANVRKARDNFELMKLEIDRLENKIQSLSEMAVNRQEPDYISAQVDQVASSMVETEKTMNELQFATGLSSADEEAPELLRAPPVLQKN